VPATFSSALKSRNGCAQSALGAFHEASRSAVAATIDHPITERLGAVIDLYKLLEPLGEGGFGVVFLAEQQQPVRRKVALKVLKPGMDTKDVIARFESHEPRGGDQWAKSCHGWS
jgi:serine/threonine protein kinase